MKNCANFKAYSANLPELLIMRVKKGWRPPPDTRRYSDMEEGEEANLLELNVFSPIRKGASLKSYLENIEDETIRNQMHEHQIQRQKGYKIAEFYEKPLKTVSNKNVTAGSMLINIRTPVLDDKSSDNRLNHEEADLPAPFPAEDKSAGSSSLVIDTSGDAAQQEQKLLQKKAALKVSHDKVTRMQKNFKQRLNQEQNSDDSSMQSFMSSIHHSNKEKNIKKRSRHSRIAAEARRKARLNAMWADEQCQVNPELNSPRQENCSNDKTEETVASVPSSIDSD